MLCTLVNASRNSQILSRYGVPPDGGLTLGIALDVLQQPSLGFHRFEPVDWRGVATALGNVTYPTRNFARLLQSVSGMVGLYLESLAVHLICDLADSLHSFAPKMFSAIHQIHDFSELHEIHSLA